MKLIDIIHNFSVKLIWQLIFGLYDINFRPKWQSIFEAFVMNRIKKFKDIWQFLIGFCEREEYFQDLEIKVHIFELSSDNVDIKMYFLMNLLIIEKTYHKIMYITRFV